MFKNFDCVVYHSPCNDGICSGWIVNKYIKDTFNKSIELLPCNAGCSPDKDLEYFRNKNIVFADICPTVEYLLKLSEFAQSIKIIDHHVTNYEKIIKTNNLPDNISHIFDMNQSGCQLVWNYFYETEQPWFVQYIGDRDIWRFNLPHTNEYIYGLSENNYINFNGFDKLYDNLNDNNFKLNIYESGKKEMEFREKNIINIIKYNKMECKYNNYRIWLYNSTKDLTSDVGNRLLKYKFSDNTLPDFCVGWIYDINKDEFWISMRSDNTKQDVSKICQTFGGGGHRNAAGCIIKNKLRDIFIPIN
jgi:oligoribonuclease NrnB/cAMP/cGMP phosphodiesterase (DHH superfamily)